MTSKERITALLTGQIPDRMGKADAPWPETRARWAREGLPAGVHANDYFKMDLRHLIRIDNSFGLPGQVVEETEDYQVVRDSNGGTTKCWNVQKHKDGVPQQLSFGLNGWDDWKRLREHLTATPDRVSFGWYGDYGFEYTNSPFSAVKAAYRDCPNKDTFLCLSAADPYEAVMPKFGDEQMLMFMATEPELVKEVFDAHAEFYCKMLDLVVAEGFGVQALFIGGDIAYKNGLLFSPAMYRQLIFPGLKKQIDHAKNNHGLKIIYHSDGNCEAAIETLIEAGIDAIQPMEVRAGMDVRKLAQRFGDRIAYMGNISTEGLAAGGERMRQEIEDKMKFLQAGRYRYIFHSDHSVPHLVSFQNYCQAMEIFEKYCRY